MKKRGFAAVLCAALLFETMQPVSAASFYQERTGMEAESREIVENGLVKETEDSVSANLPGQRLLWREEEEINVYAGLQMEAEETLQELLRDRTVGALVYLCESYGLREEPDSMARTVADLPSGQTVWISGVAIERTGNIWYKAVSYLGERQCVGYIEREYLAYSDEEFIRWEQETFRPEIAVKTMEGAKASQDIAQFPTSYQTGLQAIKNSHPNWIFVKMNTGLDWDTVISNEIGERSLVPSSSPDGWKDGNYSTSWAYASDGILRYYMDPRNFLNDTAVFQFEQLTYNASYHTQTGVQGVLSNTFMAGGIPGDKLTYAEAFWQIGNNLGVSPFHLACRVYQEQGRGTSPLISGTYSGYEGLYNYFNIGASGSTDEAVYKSGLERARSEGWTSRYASLAGGAKVISANYILKGQDTLYLQKFDVDGGYNGLYWHQYMQNICAPESEGKNIHKAYSNSGSLNNTFVFKIPVYNNMPSSACAKPGEKPVRPVDVAKVQEFVKRLYRLSLGREADEKGLAYWTGELADGRKTGAIAAKGFILSPEMERRNLSNEQFVKVLYQTFFNRTPAANDGGMAFWVDLLENGITRAYVFRGFCHSKEFAAICSDYGIEQGSVTLSENRDQNHNLTMYVYRCYDRTLGRQPDVNGLNYWTGQLINHKKTAADVAANFVFSKEFTAKKYSDEAYVKILYRMFMDREADRSGLAYWLGELKSGRRDRYKVFMGFANSKEFKAVLGTFGL